jgi:hypothetical protein
MKEGKFGIVLIDGTTSVFNVNFEASDDAHIGRNM